MIAGRVIGLQKALKILVFAFISTISPVLAQTDSSVPKNEQLIEFRDADIRSAFRSLAEAINRNIVIHPDVQGRVTIKLRNVGVIEAMRTIAGLHGYVVKDRDKLISVEPLMTQDR